MFAFGSISYSRPLLLNPRRCKYRRRSFPHPKPRRPPSPRRPAFPFRSPLLIDDKDLLLWYGNYGNPGSSSNDLPFPKLCMSQALLWLQIPPLLGMEEWKAPADLPDDHIVEILRRLPVKSLCRCKCVSRRWSSLISHPDHRRSLAQTLSGFFFHLDECGGATHPPALAWNFAGLSSPARGPPLVDPPFSFMPSYGSLQLLDSCNGLLLLRCCLSVSQSLPFYVVCDPATQKWVTLPDSSQAGIIRAASYPEEKITQFAYLGFDPAISSHFHVFQLMETEYQYEYVVEGVAIYSSETGRWVLWESGWAETVVYLPEKTTYLNGFLHFITLQGAVAAVDTKGQVWRIIHLPHGVEDGYFIGHSQGCLFYVNANPDDAFTLSIYVLEDYSSEEWTFKHSVSALDLFGPRNSQFGRCCSVLAIHPDCNLIFFYDWSRKILMSYNMNLRNVHVICTLRQVSQAHRPLLPYVPLYTEALASSNVH